MTQNFFYYLTFTMVFWKHFGNTTCTARSLQTVIWKSLPRINGGKTGSLKQQLL